ncbi:hypothetical protein DUI87_24772 [Hirundo rustica rustica]|uniref:Uncharacterized protein n=1 Tax=Hirundo rustica rustica TaxID=333673 RepID=A0A3M0JUF9_HIRRU|nr:hypothetical protein DUI87_24772 [Hirundo rustica rustica]
MENTSSSKDDEHLNTSSSMEMEETPPVPRMENTSSSKDGEHLQFQGWRTPPVPRMVITSSSIDGDHLQFQGWRTPPVGEHLKDGEMENTSRESDGKPPGMGSTGTWAALLNVIPAQGFTC